MNVVCNMPQRPSHGLVWSAPADWLLCWSCGQAIWAAAPPSETLLVVQLKCMRLRLVEGKARMSNMKSQTQQSVMQKIVFLFEYVCTSGRNTFSNSASMF